MILLTISRCLPNTPICFGKAEVLESRRDLERKEAAEKAFASFDTNDDGEKPRRRPYSSGDGEISSPSNVENFGINPKITTMTMVDNTSVINRLRAA